MQTPEPHQIRIAIAEDHALMRETICESLMEFGFRIVIQATNGHELLEQLEQNPELPDICLLDFNMPRLKGFQVSAIIRRKYPEIKTIALTNNCDIDSLIKMLQGGATSYLMKNSDPEEWCDAIRAVAQQEYFFSDWMKRSVLEYFRNQL